MWEGGGSRGWGSFVNGLWQEEAEGLLDDGSMSYDDVDDMYGDRDIRTKRGRGIKSTYKALRPTMPSPQGADLKESLGHSLGQVAVNALKMFV